MKKINKRLFSLLLILISLAGFYYVNDLNYWKHIEIKRNFVEHPEKLPTKETALRSSFWYKNFRADIFRLQTIQYIGWNAIWSEYKKYLFVILDLITELNPYFEHPYTIGQLLLPNYNERYENLTGEQQEQYKDEAVALWLKWVKNFCDSEKLERIRDENNLQKIWTDEAYKNPCSEYNIPYFLAYVYFYYKQMPEEAAYYYKVASAIEDAPSGSKVMAAIMSWKTGNREKSYFMFLNIAQSIDNSDEVCNKFSSDLEKVGAEIFINKNVPLSGTILKNISESRKKYLWEFSEEMEEEILSDTKCSNYLNKAIRELNLAYLENGEKKFFAEKWFHSIDANELYIKWFIDYLPIDFQQYEDYGIIYVYNEELDIFDYEMWKYKDEYPED